MDMTGERVLWTHSIEWKHAEALLREPLKLVKRLGIGIDTQDKRNITVEFQYNLDKGVDDTTILLQGVTGIDVITARIFRLPESFIDAKEVLSNLKLPAKMTQEIRLDLPRKVAFVHYHTDEKQMLTSTLATLTSPESLAGVLQERIKEFKVVVEGGKETGAATARIRSTRLKLFRYEWSEVCGPCCQVQGCFSASDDDTDCDYDLDLDWALGSCYTSPQPTPTSPTQPVDGSNP